jgi:hypothetical protein
VIGYEKLSVFKAPSPNAFADAVPKEPRRGMTAYANLLWAANTVKADEPVLITVTAYTSIDDALPAVGAAPCHFNVTVALVSTVTLVKYFALAPLVFINANDTD